MVEYTRDKILPEDLIQKTNLQQHNFMITAINDIDGRQADIEDVTNVNNDDIADLKTDVVALSNEKLDKADIDADLHFGDISVTRDGTAVLMTLDVFNPTTGIVTPISFTIPGATSALAGSMDASSVAWIAGAEERISALEGLSNVKAVSGLSSEPTQAQLNYAWVAATSKQAETGDIIQDVNNAKLWVFVTDTWILYGTLVIVPMATTNSIGGIKDTALNTVGNRWYCHVEADGRVALIGGDVLSTLVDTTVPALQSGINDAVMKTGDETISGGKTFTDIINVNSGAIRVAPSISNGTYVEMQVASSSATNSAMNIVTRRDGPIRVTIFSVISDGNNSYTTTLMRPSPSGNDVVNKGYLDTRLTTKQDTLVFDSTPILNSTKPVTSGGIYNALIVKADKSELTDGLALKADKTEVNGGLALKVDKGGSITVGDRMITFTNILTATWRKCRDSHVTNFVTFIRPGSDFIVDISPDRVEVHNVCKKKDDTSVDAWNTATFMVPTEWYYRVDHTPLTPNKIIEQPIFIN